MFYCLKAGALCARIIPRRIGVRIAFGVGYIFGLFPTALHKRIAKIQKRITPSLGASKSRTRVAGVVASYAFYWWDVFWLSSPRSATDIDSIVNIEGIIHFEEAISALRESNEGIIFALPHMGSWEIAGAWLGTHGYDPVVVAERLEPPELFELFTSTRTRAGMTVVAHDDHPTSKLLATLNDGGIVCLVADRDISRKGVTVTFFGADKTLPTGPAVLALKTGAVIIPVCTFVSRDSQVNIVFSPPLLMSQYQSEDRNRNIHDATQDLATIFEDMISRDPAQWHVLHDEWSRI